MMNGDIEGLDLGSNIVRSISEEEKKGNYQLVVLSKYIY